MKQLLMAGAALVVLFASSCGPTTEGEEEPGLAQSHQGICPGSGYTYKGPCYDWGAGPYNGVCGSTTYSYWQCQQYEKTINGVTYRYRAYCGAQKEACRYPTPHCLQNC